MAAYIAGNGVSRRPICLMKVKRKGKLYGCNSIYTQVIPDVLVATDDGPAEEIQNSGYSLGHEFYTRKPFSNKGARKLKLPYANWSSGPNAVQLAIDHGHNELYLFGFDFGSVTTCFNNMYAGMKHYKKYDDPPTYGGNWAQQLETIIRMNRKVQFNIVIGDATVKDYIECLIRYENVKIMCVDEFLIHINNV